jgi:DNA-binding response OmpR family regulator
LFFNANHVSTDDKIPHIIFTSIQYQGDKCIKPINDLDKLTLSPSQRNISLYFSTMDFTYKSNEIHYAYRLKGLDDKWSYTGESHSVNYNNLPPGKFVLQIRSCNSVGVWFSNTRSLVVYVTPRFCETVWCKLLYIILLLFVIAGIIYIVIYIYHLHHQAYLEQEISDVKINLFTDVSHELRTPLSLICGPIDEMMKEKNLPDSINNNLELVQKNALRLSQLVNHIFDFRKTPTETDKLIVEREDIVKHLRQIIRQFESLRMWHINIELVSQNNQSFLWVDKGKFEKIIFNLISEVCKYPIETSVKIEIKEDEDVCTISIINEYVKSDSKIRGFIDYIGRSVFFKFKSISEHNDDNMQKLLHLHGAELVDNHVGSDNISFALIFKKGYKHLVNQSYVNLIMDTIDLDYVDEQLSEELTEENSDNRISILIVEDNYDLRMFLFSILRKDYRILQASDGEEGLKKAQAEVPDFIITDVTMPVMDGMEMVRRIKSDISVCHIPIIVLSAKASLNDCVIGFKNGVDDYIVKPFSSSYLKSRIANIINQRLMLQQTYYQQFLSDQPNSSKIDINLKEPEIVDYNRDFMNKFIEYFQENISNSQLTIDDFAAYMNMSHSTFYNKVKAIVGVTPVDFIRQLRIKRATQMFEAGETSIQHVAYLSGFTDPHYFSKCFRSEMNCTPSEYIAKCKK